jgi:hypothetical protein
VSQPNEPHASKWGTASEPGHASEPDQASEPGTVSEPDQASEPGTASESGRASESGHASEPSAAFGPGAAYDPFARDPNAADPFAPGSGAANPWDPASTPFEEVPEPRRPWLTAAQAIGVLVAVSALGWPLGMLWQALAPNIPVLVVADGAVYDDTQPEQFMGGDAWFVLLGLGFGILVAVVTWFACKQLRGPLGLAVLAVGGTVAAVVAWKVGREIGVSEYLAGLHSAPEGTHLSKPNDVRIESFQWWPPRLAGVLLVPALGSVLAMTIMAAWSSVSSLREEPAMAPPPGDLPPGEAHPQIS